MVFGVVLLEATMVALVCARVDSVLIAMAKMMIAAVMAKTPAAGQKRSLSLGGSQLSSKRHLSLSKRLSARPNRVSVLRRLGHASRAYC